MDKKIKFLFIVSSIILIIVIFAINILIKRYEKEPLPSVSQENIEESVSKEGMPVKKQKETQTPLEGRESEAPTEEGVLLN